MDLAAQSCVALLPVGCSHRILRSHFPPAEDKCCWNLTWRWRWRVGCVPNISLIATWRVETVSPYSLYNTVKFCTLIHLGGRGLYSVFLQFVVTELLQKINSVWVCLGVTGLLWHTLIGSWFWVKGTRRKLDSWWESRWEGAAFCNVNVLNQLS